MSLKNILSKLSLSLVLLLVSTQAYAENPTYTWRLNQLFVNPSSASGPTTVRSPELYKLANVAAAQTDSVLIAAVTGKKIRVLALIAVAGGTATTSVFGSKAGAGATTAISPTFALPISGILPMPFTPTGWFETISGEGLVVTTGAGATTGYQIVYVAY